MYYVYVLRSVKDNTIYTGLTVNLQKRLREHREAKQGYTKGHAPYKLITYTVFSKKELARKFEEYLKSGSGRAFISRHLL